MDKIIQCDVTQGIPLPDKSVHCVITSPPYWGLRDYGIPGQLGLEKTLAEYIEKMVAVFRAVWRVLRDDGTCWLNMGDSYAGTGCGNDGKQAYLKKSFRRDKADVPKQRAVPGFKPKDLCMMPHRLAMALQKDGWWIRSDIVWHKPNPMPESVTDRPTKSHEYIFLMAKSGRPLFWVNNTTAVATRIEPKGTQGAEGKDWEWIKHATCKGKGCDKKRCIDGKIKSSLWESHKYFYDADAIREGYLPQSYERVKYTIEVSTSPGRHKPDNKDFRFQEKHIRDLNPAGRNKRSVWTIEGYSWVWEWLLDNHPDILSEMVANEKLDTWMIPTQSYSEAHFATFPEKLVDPCIKAATSEKGCCSVCGAPWVRIVEKDRQPTRAGLSQKTEDYNYDTQRHVTTFTTTGWKQTCKHSGEPVPAVVFDPFMGSGTVGLVAYKLNRHYIGTELSQEYIDMAERRIGKEKAKYGLFEA